MSSLRILNYKQMIDQSTQTISELKPVRLNLATRNASSQLKKSFQSILGNKFVTLFTAFLLFASLNSFGQYNLSVSFNDGFVGDNTANNSSTNAALLTAKGWSLAQFTQNSTAAIFTAQGNDIIGNVVLKDANGTIFTIPGFI